MGVREFVEKNPTFTSNHVESRREIERQLKRGSGTSRCQRHCSSWTFKTKKEKLMLPERDFLLHDIFLKEKSKRRRVQVSVSWSRQQMWEADAKMASRTFTFHGQLLFHPYTRFEIRASRAVEKFLFLLKKLECQTKKGLRPCDSGTGGNCTAY